MSNPLNDLAYNTLMNQSAAINREKEKQPASLGVLYSTVYGHVLSLFQAINLLCPHPYGRSIRRWCASDVCLSCTSGLSREQSGLRRLKLAQR